MAAPVNFVSQTQLNAKKALKRKAREEILQKAKEEYEKEERRKEKRKETGEDTWMLPSVSDRVTENNIKKKSSKKKKHKKEKKSRKLKKDKKASTEGGSSSESEDEWVVKETPAVESDNPQTQITQQRDSWMLLPTFSNSSKRAQQEEREIEEEEQREKEKKLSCLDTPGQHEKELNPYWKDGGAGLPTANDENSNQDSGSVSYDLGFLRKAYKRSVEQSKEEGRSLEEVVADRWGSIKRLQSLIKAAEMSIKPDGRSDQFDSRSSKRPEKGSERGDRRDRNELERARDSDRDWQRGDGRPHREHRQEGREQESKRDSQNGDDGRPHREERQVGRDHRHESDRRRDLTSSRLSGDRSRRNMFMRPDDSRPSSSSSRFMRPSSSTAEPSSSSWSSFSEHPTPSAVIRNYPQTSRSSGGWRKQTKNKEKEMVEEVKERKRMSSSSESSLESEGSISDGEPTEKKQGTKPPTPEAVVPKRRVTEADLNSMGAKIVKAELMGNEEQAAKLRQELKQMRQDKQAQDANPATRAGPREEEVVVLTRTDKSGNTRPVQMNEAAEPKGGRRKKKKVATHGASGDRERYFADDDRFSLQDMVRMERMNTAEDYDAMFSRLASKGASKTDSDNFTLDDHFVTAAATKLTPAQAEERERHKAIAEHKRLSEQLSKCRFCFENTDLKKHLIIAIGIQTYLALPLHQSLTDGHCLIVPMQHSLATTLIDEDVHDEIKIFKKGLTKMFEEMDRDVVFLETCRSLKRQNHMIVECVPIPKEDGDMAPIYFKKAIMEADVEWAQNKRLIDTRDKTLRSSIPRGLPFFHVEFGLDGGFAHIIEDEELFPQYFGKEIIGGMLDLDPYRWRKPRTESFQEHKTKVLQFAEWWKPYDWTQRIDRSKKS